MSLSRRAVAAAMLATTLALALGAARALPAQGAAASSVAAHVAQGDQAAAALNPAGALTHYETALAADPRHYEALWKAARSAVDLGEYEPVRARQLDFFQRAEDYARRAVEANPADAEGHFHLARALGRNALTQGIRDRVKYATDVRAHALEALRLNPRHPGALHVMGVWNAEVRRLGGFQRMIARNFLGGRVFGSANWDDAVRYMEQAATVEPGRIVHRLDLARVYRDTGATDKAREQYEQLLRMRATDYNDRSYKREAEQELRALR